MTTLILPPAKPPMVNVVAAFDPRLINSAAVAGANSVLAHRVTIPYSGILRDFTIYIGFSAGNVDGGIYDTSLTTRNKLWTSGSVAAGTASSWQTLGDPQLPVQAGDQVDFCVATDSATCTFGKLTTGLPATSVLPASFWPSPLGGNNKIAWTKTASFPLPTTFTEGAGMAVASYFAFAMCRLVPA